ncbi:MAG: acetylglutamate kinase [Candidatus Eiseniibacteriota bacterium]
MSAAPLVLKVGGRALEETSASEELGPAIAALRARGVDVIVVHGGGAEVSRWSEQLGHAPRFHGGRRVTDPRTLEVATAVLAGLANKRLVAALRAHGVDAVGLSALDGGIARVEPHADAALGEVGRVESIEAGLLRDLLASGRTPVLASIGATESRLLNLNADDLAAAVAPAVSARALVLLSDTPGLVLDGAVVPELDRDALEAALASPQVGGGMGPKLACARTALDRGVPEVWISAWSGTSTLERILARETDAAAGTEVLRGTRLTLEGGASAPVASPTNRIVPEGVSPG